MEKRDMKAGREDLEPSEERAIVKKRRLIVPELHLFNFPFVWVLSFFRSIRVFYVAPSFPFRSDRIRNLDLVSYFSPDAAQIHRERACQRWLRIRDIFPAHLWRASLARREVDFSPRAKQMLSHYFDRYFMLAEFLKDEPAETRVLDTVPFRMLRQIDPTVGEMYVNRWSVLSFVNVALDCLQRTARNVAGVGRLLGWILAALVIRRGCFCKGAIRILWDAVNSNEFSLKEDERSFKWILDGRKMDATQILFLLWQKPSKTFRSEIDRSGLNALTLAQAYRALPIGTLLRSLAFLTWTVVSRFSRMLFSLRESHMASFLIEAHRYEPIVAHCEPRVYVECNSQFGNEGAHLALLKAAAIRVVMYCYSVNSYHWMSDPDSRCDQKTTLFVDILADELVGWHQDFAEFIEQHPQTSCKVRVMGPLMPGDESVMFQDVRDLRRRLKIPEPEKARYLSFFDVTPVAKNVNLAGVYSVFYSENYVDAFLTDMIRLLSDFEDLVLIYKPKKRFVSGLFSYSKNHQGRLDHFQRSGRGVVLNENVNPWIPIKLADVCVALPFTSPVLAAVHHGRHGLFHDPTHIVRKHRFDAIEGFITSNYEALRDRVRQCLEEPAVPVSPLWSNFIGKHPGTSSTDQFRMYLQTAGAPTR